MNRRSVRQLLLGLTASLGATTIAVLPASSAAPTPPAATTSPPTLPPHVAAFFDSHCASCHDADTMKGGLDLSAVKLDFASRPGAIQWTDIHDRIASGEMPPKNKKRPPAAEQKAV